MENILTYILIGIITTGILELRLLIVNKNMNWVDRLVAVLTYPVILFNLYMDSKNGTIITGYLFALWVLYNIIITL